MAQKKKGHSQGRGGLGAEPALLQPRSDASVDAAQQKDAVERLSHVVAFAMTSSENEEFSKKPLNPVLGEELTCWTDHADGSRTVFRAEQVSHHPPMSCFFMFNETHNVFFECNVE